MLSEKPHRRYNILTGEWILVSPHRTKRPWQGKEEKLPSFDQPAYHANCYLCPSNIRAGGIKNENYSSTYSFVNDFGALLLENENESFENGLLKGKVEKGICRVICFSPDHSLTLPLMKVSDITDVIRLWKKEYKELGERPEINHVQIFENKGAIMGCSNPHPHGQIWAQSSIPEEINKKSFHLKTHFDKHNRSLLIDYLEQEIKADERIVFSNDHFVVLVPFWAIWPYETMVIPRKHYQHIRQLNTDEEAAFAEAIKVVTTKYDNIFETSFPYSSGIHQRPTDGNEYSEWHFHMCFYPPLLRSATVKKFMVGYELFANPQRDITAEMAAKTLKHLPEIHFTSIE
ncbi:UDP-glucose--hexose-1-phosphate uridylyltransferase [Croceitalea rosinachiae]